LKEEDQTKMSFITPFNAYCYTTMSFGLKNATATYQRAIQHCLKDQIGHNVQPYINDVVVKSKPTDKFITDLEQTFKALKEFWWRLNLAKCIFSVPSDNYIVSARGIEANPEKVSAITQMKRPTYVKDVQKLIGCMAALSRFRPHLGEKGLPFFKLLKASERFEWMEEADEAFAKLK